MKQEPTYILQSRVLVTRRTHNPRYAGSNPASVTIKIVNDTDVIYYLLNNDRRKEILSVGSSIRKVSARVFGWMGVAL